MTDSGPGQGDNRDWQPGGAGDDYRPSSTWDGNRGSSWEDTSPNESPFAGSSGTAAERPADNGPWPNYPDSSGSGYGHPGSSGSASEPPQPYGYAGPVDYSAPSGYAQSAYPPEDYAQPNPYGSQPGYGQPQTYGQPPGYPVNPYQPPTYAGYALPNHPQATLALILGLVGLIALPSTCVGALIGIGGIAVGSRVRREIDASPGQWAGRSSATAGWVMGIIAVVGFTLAVVSVVILGLAGYVDS